MTQPPPSDSQSPAERLYFDFAAQRERGEAGPADFDALCQAHPELAAELGQLAARDRQIASILGSGNLRDITELEDDDPNPILFQAGRQIGDFRLERRIGKGGMGQVWEATELSLQRRVALKFVRSDRISEPYLARFEVEARAGGRADHPNLVRTLGRGQADGIDWIAQELVVGAKSLRNKLDELRREHTRRREFYEEAAMMIRDAALGMQAAHDAGVIHRDLKPENILLDRSGRPRIVDFGLARMLEEPGNTKVGHVAGTLYYMSPEQTEGKSAALDHRTDIFSLGVVLYELLTLQRPFEGESSQEILEKVRTLDPIDPRQLRANCPKDLSTICLKALEKRPGARFATMLALAEDLNRFLKHEPILARPSTRLELARKWVRRNPGPSVGIGVGAAALVVISGLLVQQLRTASALKKSNVDLAAQTSRAEDNEREAQHNAETAQRNAETAQRNANEAKANMELAERNAETAQRNANEAKANMELAERNAETAQRNANDATQKANDVLSLSAQKDYEDLVAAAEKLWPASSEMVPRYEEWLEKARELIEGRPADDSKQQKKRPSLVEHKAKLSELRREALPLSEEQVRVDHETHPQFAEWQSQSADLLWRSRMLAIEAWPDRAAVEAELAAESAAKQLPSDPDSLNALAWKLVDPKQPVIGQEVRALLLAKRALDASSEEKRAGIRDTYAWALYRNGKLDEGLAEMKTALTEPGGDELKQSAKDLKKAVQQWQGDEVSKRRERRDHLAQEVDALFAAVNERRTFEYTDAEKTWWDRQLRVLVQNLANFQNPDSGLMGSGVNPAFGWGVQKRYEFAKSVREQTITSAEAKRRWDEAILAIAKSEKYRDTLFPGGGLLTPQEGLLPLGPDPQSGLWEFWHVQSGDEPERDKDGNFVRQKSGAHKLVEKSGRGTGIVLVLIPGGTFWMGAQRTDPNGQNYDPQAGASESPVHSVVLSPYLLSKYEMTQGQWLRFSRANPSRYKSGLPTVGIMNPVEQVDWSDCRSLLQKLGLELPSEAQWEFACRAGTSSVWWTGSQMESLADSVNLADQSFVSSRGDAAMIAWWPEFVDGFPVHAPVGCLRPNHFGLHEIVGNVWEWCFDAHEPYSLALSHDPRPDGAAATARVSRGGGFIGSSRIARSSYRGEYKPTTQNPDTGVRPSRALRLSTSPPHLPK